MQPKIRLKKLQILYLRYFRLAPVQKEEQKILGKKSKPNQIGFHIFSLS